MHCRSVTILLLVLLLVVSSCIEQLEWRESENPSGQLVVEGSITSEQKSHIIKLTRTQGVVVAGSPSPVAGATVTIDDGSVTFPLTETKPGVYETANNVKGMVGNTYHLLVALNGEQYEAYAIMKKAEPIEPINISKWDINPSSSLITGEDYFQFIYRDNFGSPAPYKYEVITEIDPDLKDYYPSGWQPPRWLQFHLNKYALLNDPVSSDSTYYLHPGLEPPAIFAY
ncbi:MAG: DUF4249 family protein, partial [Cyclobacteriaceae bacterium]